MILNLIVGGIAAITAASAANSVAKEGHKNSHGPRGYGAGRPGGGPHSSNNVSTPSQSTVRLQSRCGAGRP